MIRNLMVLAAAALFALASPSKPSSPSGRLRIDSHYSSAQLSTDGTTDFGKTKTIFTVGVGRVTGKVNLDNNDPALSTFDFTIYPSTSMVTPIDEDGKLKSDWFANTANNTLVCFHSKGVYPTEDGHLRTTGKLVLTRVDRNIEVNANEAYAGPVYGPPMIHKVVEEATFVFDAPTAGGSGQAEAIQTRGSTKVVREDFPQLVKTVLSTYWPPVVQDEKCVTPSIGEDFAGIQCTGTLIRIPDFPASGANPSEDYPGPPNFNIVTGQRLTISVNLRLAAIGAASQAPAGN